MSLSGMGQLAPQAPPKKVDEFSRYRQEREFMDRVIMAEASRPNWLLVLIWVFFVLCLYVAMVSK